MSSTVGRFAWNSSKSRFLVSVAVTVLLAACSADSERFAENPSDADPVYTASVPKQKKLATEMPDEEIVASRPLGSASGEPPRYDYSKSYRAQQYKQPSMAEAPQVETVEAPQATASGTVTVGPGMTLYSIARANNLSVSELASANGIRAPYSVHTGQKLRVPGADEPALPETAAVAPRATGQDKPLKRSASGHRVNSGETLFSLGRKYGVSPYAIADANGLPHNAQLALGQQVRIPGGKGGDSTMAAAESDSLESPKLDAPAKTASAALPDAVGTENVPATTQPTDVAENAAPEVEQSAPASQPALGSGPAGMRWPVRGKVISAFGPKTNGLKNEGINIAVPEGTSVRAADAGVIAYAGNELKGYGNLVLIRHENGYVTAYAHAKELFVKRGDTVKRGDVIAKAGQTGSVSSPQLHFEVRKGATALDPMKFLNAATASN